MRDCRLIIFEGLMGSGKSTLATQTALKLQDRNIPYRYYWESELPHPVKIRGKMGQRTLSAEEQIERSLLKWRAFAAQAADRVTVFDGQLFHVNVTNIVKRNGTREQIEIYIRALVDIIQPLNPRLVYFYQNDIEGALRKVGDERGARFEEKQITDKVDCPFGETHGLSGFSGLVRFCEMYRKITDHLFEIMEMDKLSIENSAGDWAAYNQQVFEFLSLVPNDERLWLGNAHIDQGQGERPSRMCFENQTDCFVAVYDWKYKSVEGRYRFEILPREQRFHDALLGERYRLHDANTGEILRDVIVGRAEQTVLIRGHQ